MYTLCWSPKGGSGTTVTTVALGIAHDEPVTIIDLDGDIPAVLGVNDDGPGIYDWLEATRRPDLAELATDITDELRLIRCGQTKSVSPIAWADLADELARSNRYVVDSGTRAHMNDIANPLLLQSARTLTVLRPCYLALRRARIAGAAESDGIVLVQEPSRAIRAHDVATCLGVPIAAVVHIDVAVARAVDAGLLAHRLPRSLQTLEALAI